MPLIRANDRSFHGVTTKILNIDVKFTALGHAVVSDRQLSFIEQHFQSFDVIDPELSDPSSPDVPSVTGIYHGDDLIAVKSIGAPARLPCLRSQTTSTPFGPAYFDASGHGFFPKHIADFFAQVPTAFVVEGAEAEERFSENEIRGGFTDQEISLVAANQTATLSGNKKPTVREERAAKAKAVKEAKALETALTEAAVAVLDNPADDAGVPAESEGKTEREKFLRGLPISLLRKEASKVGVNPFGGKTPDDIINEMLGK